jgi:hypothetical protein
MVQETNKTKREILTDCKTLREKTETERVGLSRFRRAFEQRLGNAVSRIGIRSKEQNNQLGMTFELPIVKSSQVS